MLGRGVAAWLRPAQGRGCLREEAARRLTAAEITRGAGARARDACSPAICARPRRSSRCSRRGSSESQSQQAALEALYRDLAPSRDDIALNEVEQILLIANQQLALAGNVPAALAALQLADGKLARIDRPPLVPLRRALARDVDRLKALPFVDVPAITLQARPGDRAGGRAAARERRAPAAAETPRHRRSSEPPWRRALREIVSASYGRWCGSRSASRPAAPLVAPDAGVFPSREPAPAPAVGADRDPRPAGSDVQVRPARRAGVGAQVFRYAHEAGAEPARYPRADARDAAARRPAGSRGEPRGGAHAQGSAGPPRLPTPPMPARANR